MKTIWINPPLFISKLVYGGNREMLAVISAGCLSGISWWYSIPMFLESVWCRSCWLMLFSPFLDAINDPIIGGLRIRRIPDGDAIVPFVCCLLTALVPDFHFWAHPDWSQTHKIIYMVLWLYCILVLGYTCVNIPLWNVVWCNDSRIWPNEHTNQYFPVGGAKDSYWNYQHHYDSIDWMVGNGIGQGYLLIA